VNDRAEAAVRHRPMGMIGAALPSPEETHRLTELLVVLGEVDRLMDAIDRHARGPSAINSRQMDTATQRTITSGTHTRAVIASHPGSSRADQVWQ
jgi:hypothetical protein